MKLNCSNAAYPIAPMLSHSLKWRLISVPYLPYAHDVLEKKKCSAEMIIRIWDSTPRYPECSDANVEQRLNPRKFFKCRRLMRDVNCVNVWCDPNAQMITLLYNNRFRSYIVRKRRLRCKDFRDEIWVFVSWWEKICAVWNNANKCLKLRWYRSKV